MKLKFCSVALLLAILINRLKTNFNVMKGFPGDIYSKLIKENLIDIFLDFYQYPKEKSIKFMID
jgi:hypothetical protein